MKNILKCEINSNVLKTIAIIAMVIDHIGLYFEDSLPHNIYWLFRGVGRIAMPIFVYLLVQGFFYTKNFKKYISRIVVLALITQILMTILFLISIKFFPLYILPKQLYMTGNILFTFVILLLVLKILHQDILVSKWDYNKNIWLKIILVSLIILAAIIIPLDYGEIAVVLGILLYYIEKLKIKLYMYRNNTTTLISNVILNIVNEKKMKIIYVFFILLTFIILVLYFNLSVSTLFAIIPIALYNGEKGRKNIKNIYYITFPLHHVLICTVAMMFKYIALT